MKNAIPQYVMVVERFEVRVEGDRVLVSDETVQPEARGTSGRQ